MEKQFMDYQERLEQNKEEAVKNFYDKLLGYNIDLKRIDKLTIKHVGFLYKYVTIITEEGEKEEVFDWKKDDELFCALMGNERIIEEKTGLKIKHDFEIKRQNLFVSGCHSWEIDCTGIK